MTFEHHLTAGAPAVEAVAIPAQFSPAGQRAPIPAVGLRELNVEPVDPASLVPIVGPSTRQYLRDIRTAEAETGERIAEDGKLVLDLLLARAARDLEGHLAVGFANGLNAAGIYAANGGRPAYTSSRPPLIPRPGESMFDFALRTRAHQEITIRVGEHKVTLQRTCDGRYESEIYPLDYWTVERGYASTGDWGRVQDGTDFFAHRILKHGYPFNGNRIEVEGDGEEEPSDVANYYARRSQPPTFPYMVRLLGEHLGEDVYAHEPYVKAMELLWQHFNPEPDLLAEQPRGQFHAIRRGGISPEGLPFSVFGDDTNNGRPYEEYIGRLESFAEDEETATRAAERAESEGRDRVRALGDTLVHLLAAGEFGWDMSASRLAGGKDLSYINTTNIVPLELQCEIADMAEILAYMYDVKARRAADQGNFDEALEHHERHLHFTDQRAKRIQFINTYMRDPETGIPHDLELIGPSASYDSLRTYQGFRRTPVISAAILHTLYSGVVQSPEDALAIVQTARRELLGPGGLAVTNMETEEQWDAPNAWASTDRIGVFGPLHASARFANEAPDVAEALLQFSIDVRESSLHGSRVAYEATGTIVETVNARRPNKRPQRGEYPKDLSNPNTPRNFAMQVGKVIELTVTDPRAKRDRLIPVAGRFVVASSRQ